MIGIEGIDGAGKRTLFGKLSTALTERGLSVRGRAFPRYGVDVHADLVRDALHGDLGPVSDSPHAMGLLYALDRRDAAEGLRADLERYDVVLLDRYVASNAAYGAARLRQDADGDFVRWVHDLEISRFRLPVPDAHLLLSVTPTVAASRVTRREATEVGRERDIYESDADLQARCAALYEQLARRGWLAPWTVVDAVSTVDTNRLVDELFG
ncbi:dTMP kinase [Actinoalloteichus cyanogriseus DSM 43889]|uniref:Thymidylate kinase n=1 Tax=Actinoalloteichus caeruleus DSM 43889 TaxID=1120930 RepID=A0ABT1JMH7_ACTCY|nr:dTMP kinase [Actinoalloteichus caeruleus DSM 43889]